MLGLLGAIKAKLQSETHMEATYNHMSYEKQPSESHATITHDLGYNSLEQDVLLNGVLELSVSFDEPVKCAENVLQEPEDTDDSGFPSNDNSFSDESNVCNACQGDKMTDCTRLSSGKAGMVSAFTSDVWSNNDLHSTEWRYSASNPDLEHDVSDSGQKEIDDVEEDRDLDSDGDQYGPDRVYDDQSGDDEGCHLDVGCVWSHGVEFIKTSENDAIEIKSCYSESEDDNEHTDDDQERSDDEQKQGDDEREQSDDEHEQSESEQEQSDDELEQSEYEQEQSDKEQGQTEDEEDDGDDDCEEQITDNKKLETISDDEEGGWIDSESEEDSQSSNDMSANNNDNDSDVGMEIYDLFADGTTISYENDVDDDEPIPIIPTRATGRKSANKVVVSTYPCRNPRYSRQTGVSTSRHIQNTGDSFNDSFNWHEEATTADDIIAFCSPSPAMKQGVYCFPRIHPEDIGDICEFWEYDFQVDTKIIPRMSIWERLGIAPSRAENPDHYQQYLTYKNLYLKWTQCHKCKDQWYRKYGWSSLKRVLNAKSQNRKVYPDKCQTITGLAEKLEVFRLYYDCVCIGSPGVLTDGTKSRE